MGDAAKYLTEEALADPEWADRIKAAMPESLIISGELLDDDDDIDKARQELEEICEAVLTDPRAIGHPDWGELVRAVVELSEDYRELTEDAYYEALDPDDAADDEGGVVEMIFDLGLCTSDLALKLLAHPEAVEREDWADLVRYALDEKARRFGTSLYLSVGWEEADELFESEAVQHHPQAAELWRHADEILPLKSDPIE